MAAAYHPARSTTAPIPTLLQKGIDTHVYPGAVWAVGDADGQQASGALGVLDPTDPAAPMTTDTVFDVASLTKIMAAWAPVGMPSAAAFSMNSCTDRRAKPSSTPTGPLSSSASSSRPDHNRARRHCPPAHLGATGHG